jgi:hypothetical protein
MMRRLLFGINISPEDGADIFDAVMCLLPSLLNKDTLRSDVARRDTKHIMLLEHNLSAIYKRWILRIDYFSSSVHFYVKSTTYGLGPMSIIWSAYELMEFVVKNNVIYALPGNACHRMSFMGCFRTRSKKVVDILQQFFCGESGLPNMVMAYIYGDDVWNLMYCGRLAIGAYDVPVQRA